MVDHASSTASTAHTEAPPAPTVFRRSATAQVGGAIGATIGAIAFGGFAAVILAGVLIQDLVQQILFGGLVGFFAVLMGASALAALKRGRDTRVAEVGPDGAWTPEMGLVPWAEMTAVRLELVAGPAGSRNARLRLRRRLGFHPVEGHARPITAAGLEVRMTQAYLDLLRRLAPSASLGTAKLAPFGVSEVDLPRDFDRLVGEARRYVAVADATDTSP